MASSLLIAAVHRSPPNHVCVNCSRSAVGPMLGARALARRAPGRAVSLLGRAYISSSEIGPVWQHVARTPDDGGKTTLVRLPSSQHGANLFTGLMLAGGAAVGLVHCQGHEDDDQDTEIENWSSTHSVKTKAYLQPESVDEVERIISKAHIEGNRVRVVGNALSPNGIGLSKDTMLSLAQCDRVLHVDERHKRVTVQAGMRVQQLVDALKPHDLTLQNYASINEQQLGGFLQVGAHGTGANVPPVDEQVVALKIVTPGLGTIELSHKDNPDLFRMVKVGLGALGVVVEMTIQCVDRHELKEITSVMTRAQVKEKHHSLLKDNEHVRYMWIPHTDAVVVVRCNRLGINDKLLRRPTQPPKHLVTCAEGLDGNQGEALEPMRTLLLSRLGSNLPDAALDDIEALNFAGLRGKLLDEAPLDMAWVKKVNEAEAEYWRRSQGTRVDWSDKLLAFECGGQQWVNEVCFPVGTLAEPNDRDVQYMEELMRIIDKGDIPAPAPIEQRWTSSSSATMSPAHDAAAPETIFSWVGIIMYLNSEDVDSRTRVTDAFLSYRDLCKTQLWDRYDCAVHWAKLEKPRSEEEARDTRARLGRRFPVEKFNAVRALLDPKNIMANDHIDSCFGARQ